MKSKSERQRDQRQMVEEAKRHPGVATAARVYGNAKQYVPPPTVPSSAGFQYATGGNGR